MNRGARSFFSIVLAFTIAFVAAIAAVAVTKVLDSQSQFVPGVTNLVVAVALLYVVEKFFLKVYYPRRHPRYWWENRGVVAIAAAIVFSILSSAVASIWFGSVVASGALVALFLHFRNGSREQ